MRTLLWESVVEASLVLWAGYVYVPVGSILELAVRGSPAPAAAPGTRLARSMPWDAALGESAGGATRAW
jgi:hypothetical protein